jgi:hypothetical protein
MSDTPCRRIEMRRRIGGHEGAPTGVRASGGFGSRAWVGVLAWVGAALPAGLSAQAAVGAPAHRIVLEPDMLVSRDGGGAHVELDLAAHPWRPGVLVGAAITHGRPDGGPGTRVYTTTDGGLDWTAVTLPEQQRWGGADPQVALSDGSLLMTWHDFPIDPRERTLAGPRTSTQWSELSTDGGVTFGPGRRVTDKVAPSYESPDMRLSTDPAVAVSRSAQFRDRIYIVWADFREGSPRIMIRSSSDRGASWTAAHPIDPGAPATAKQFQPTQRTRTACSIRSGPMREPGPTRSGRPVSGWTARRPPR